MEDIKVYMNSTLNQKVNSTKSGAVWDIEYYKLCIIAHFMMMTLIGDGDVMMMWIVMWMMMMTMIMMMIMMMIQFILTQYCL